MAFAFQQSAFQNNAFQGEAEDAVATRSGGDGFRRWPRTVILRGRPPDPTPQAGETPRKVTRRIIRRAMVEATGWPWTIAEAQEALPERIPIPDYVSDTDYAALQAKVTAYLERAAQMRRDEEADEEAAIEMLLLAA